MHIPECNHRVTENGNEEGCEAEISVKAKD